MKLRNYFFIFIALLAACLISFMIGFRSSIFKSIEKETSQVILNKIERVAKLVTIEGQFSEIYDYRHSYTNWPFEKKALVKVKATAMVGYDLEKIQIDVDNSSKTISISNISEPSLLSLDHDLEYYDLQEGFFNPFTSEDLTKINKQAKSFIEEKVKHSKLLSESEKQKNDLIDMLRMTLSNSDWQIIVEGEPLKN